MKKANNSKMFDFFFNWEFKGKIMRLFL